MTGERLGNILLRQGLIEAHQLDFCLSVQKNNGGERLGRLLEHYDFVDEDHVAKALALQAGLAVYQGAFTVDERMAALLGTAFLLEHAVFPALTDKGTVCVMARTDNMATTDMVQGKVGAKVEFQLAPPTALRKALEKLSLREAQAGQKAAKDQEDDLNAWLEGILGRAIAEGASDIHIEASQKTVEIRYRLDGILHFMDSMKMALLPRIINIIFHKADVTVSDFTHAHDARFTYMCSGREVDVRVSHIPGVHGSSVVLRLLDKGKAAIALTDLGYGPRQWEMIQAGLLKPEGITLVVGPTGCGKTTTLYAMLNQLKSITTKIMTIEDPVEMHVPLLTQVQMQEKRGISFGNAVRAFLRHDPDIILIGEIRDAATAQEAMRASMTGHKVFATLHAGRPLDAILRLHDLGVPFTYLAENINMVITQRLLRRSCREGTRGRVVVAEVMSIDDDMRGLIASGDMAGLRRHLKATSHITMRDDAGRLLQEGVVDAQEVARVLG